MINGFAFDIYDIIDTANSKMKVNIKHSGGKNIPQDQQNINECFTECVSDNYNIFIDLNNQFKDLKM